MKKYLLISAAVAALMVLPACNKTEQKNAKPKTEQSATETDESYTPSGNPTKDAKAIADLTIDLSRKMMKGESNADEQVRVDKMIKIANDFYTKQNRGEEFQAALTEATESAINDLATELGK